ncbi:hypothetical protein [Acinetobacter entericus]|uniref:DUF2750 domain-containing protein n=1 Tax=Acinetobacter entericus TaxID=2989714 RepID=A0ABT3NG13_9GAMM|nr:hypothetical protein [Acinetobacter entericus]MCW8037905.1 hypothetical protein [Acinetobacter entericus]
MDIQKEKEAFENWWESFHNGRQISCDYVEEDNSYSVGYANAQWVAWQAKAQSVPEGFVLVSKDRLAKAVDGIEALFEEYSLLALGELLPIQQDLNAMIEAQEQGHD